MGFTIDAVNGEARRGILKVDGKKLETPFLFPVMSFFCGGDWSSKFGGGIYRDIKEYLMKPEFEKFFPGIMTSIAQINDFPVTKDKFENVYLSQTVSKRFNYKGILFVDSGGFKLLTNGGIHGKDFDIENRRQVLEYQKKFGADIIASLDYPIYPGIKKAERKNRINFSIRNAIYLIKNKPRKTLSYLAVHGHSKEELKFFLDKLLNGIDRNGISFRRIDGIALGSLVPLRKDREKIIEIIKSAKEVLKESGLDYLPMHVFGISGNLINKMIDLGVDTFDSSSYVYSAINGVYIKKNSSRENISSVKRDCNCAICKDDFSWNKMKNNYKGLLSRERTAPLAIHNYLIYSKKVEDAKKKIKYLYIMRLF